MARVRINGVCFRCEIDTLTSGFPRKRCHFCEFVSAFPSNATANIFHSLGSKRRGSYWTACFDLRVFGLPVFCSCFGLIPLLTSRLSLRSFAFLKVVSAVLPTLSSLGSPFLVRM